VGRACRCWIGFGLRLEAGARPEGGWAAWCTEPGADRALACSSRPHSVSQSGIALQLHHVITLVYNYHNNELFVLGAGGVGLEHGTRGLDKREFVGGKCYCSKVTCLNRAPVSHWYPVRREQILSSWASYFRIY
jgi:hypothetical protein